MKTMKDASGNEIPVKYVNAYDKKRDKVVKRIVERWIKARKGLEKCLKECLNDLEGLMEAKEKLGSKGNFAARSFDALMQVSIDQSYCIMLDERVVRARELMMGYVNGLLDTIEKKEAAAGLKVIIGEAFRQNARGFLPVSRILALLRMNIKDAGWLEAKDLLLAAIQPVKGKRYLHVETRKSVQEQWRNVRLDVADCWPDEK